MLSSISAPKPNSSWLDRLRYSKGFTISDDLETIDQFLSSNPNPNPNPIPKPRSNPPIAKDHTMFDLMSGVLSDLFIMGEPRHPPNHQKSSRKQPNPRICHDVRSVAGGNREVSPSSVNNSVAEGKKRKTTVRKRSDAGTKASNLSGFSRTEVTVIDTSLSPEWKAARVLYRKGLVWKVREKKVVRIVRKKRRRVGPTEKLASGHERKVIGSQREQYVEFLDKGSTQTDKRDDFKETEDQALIPAIIPRRPKFARSPRVPAAKNSNILRLKIISKKNVATGSRNVLKEK